MTTVRYAIHGLIDILVDSRVSDSVIEQIDFQIGYFKTTGDQPPAPHQIIVKPYDDFVVDPALTFDTFHLSRGVTGKILDEPKRRLAVEKEQNGYTFHADSPFLINLYIQLLLVEHGISLVHAAAVADRDGRVTLFPGAGGVGKTALLGYLIKQCSYRAMGDDIIGLTEKGECLSFPRSFILKEYHRSVYPEIFQRLNIEPPKKTDTSSELSLKRFIKENAPFMGVTKSILRRLDLLDKVTQRSSTPGAKHFVALPVQDVLGPGTIADQGSIDRIVFLQRYAGAQLRVVSMSEETLCRRMFAILQHEWVSIMRELFTMGALEIVDLLAYFDRVAAIMRSGVAGKKCELLLMPDNASPSELSDYLFGKHTGFRTKRDLVT